MTGSKEWKRIVMRRTPEIERLCVTISDQRQEIQRLRSRILELEYARRVLYVGDGSKPI